MPFVHLYSKYTPFKRINILSLMETHNLRTLFLPSMRGLHLRLYQLHRLVKIHLPKLHMHLTNLHVPTALYASQWFLTLFAYTYPLRFVLRVWDIAISEGWVETVMRIGMCLLQKAEQRILRCDDFEEVVRVLTKTLWIPEDVEEKEWERKIEQQVKMTLGKDESQNKAINDAIEPAADSGRKSLEGVTPGKGRILRAVIVEDLARWTKLISKESLIKLEMDYENDAKIKRENARSGKSRHERVGSGVMSAPGFSTSPFKDSKILRRGSTVV